MFGKFNSAGIHAEAAYKFPFQTFISLCRKICHKAAFALAISFHLLKWILLPFLALNTALLLAVKQAG